MRGAVLILAVVAAWCAVAASEPNIGLGLFGLVGIKVIASLLKARDYPYYGIGKRSVVESTAILERELLLSSLSQLDPNGCLLKLLCHLETKEADALSRHETILSGMFREATEDVTPSNAAFTYAVGIGSKSRDAAACDKIFSKCPLKYSQLSIVLEESWACPIGGSLLI